MRFYSVTHYREWKERLPLSAAALFLVCAFLLALPAMADTRRIEGLTFESVLVFGDVEVEISEAEDVELLVRGDASDLSRQPFALEDGTLLLGVSTTDRGASFSGVQFKLRTPKLEHLELRGSGKAYLRPFRGERLFASVTGTGELRLYPQRAQEIVLQLTGTGDLLAQALDGRSLQASLSGSGDLEMGRVEVEVLSVSVRGAGDLSVNERGQAQSLKANVIGSGDIDLATLDAQGAEVNVVGSGDVMLGLVENLEVNILGSGNVSYRGQPDISQTLLGSGEVQQSR